MKEKHIIHEEWNKLRMIKNPTKYQVIARHTLAWVLGYAYIPPETFVKEIKNE